MVNFESTFSPGEGFGTTSYSYVYNGGQLSQMTVTTVTETADGQTSTQTHTVDLTYDASGNPQTMTYDGTTYYYAVNIQGDVTGIVDESGNVLVRYYYQGYGITYYSVPAGDLGETLVKINPFIYRGYVYDKETKLYYLQSRYYNRTSGRFLNADALVATGQGLLGNNMFAYCGNNPVMRVDFSGTAYKPTVTMISIAGNGSKKQVHQPPDYIQIDSDTINCYSYAFGLAEGYDPGEITGHGPMYQNGKKFYTVEEIARLIQYDIDAGCVAARRINDPSEVQEDEYLVVLKTSTKPSPKNGVGDYHFVIRLSNGTWADKPGPSPSRWNAVDGFADAWPLGEDLYYYNGGTAYFAVRRKE